jgi:hypothetical protein
LALVTKLGETLQAPVADLYEWTSKHSAAVRDAQMSFDVKKVTTNRTQARSCTIFRETSNEIVMQNIASMTSQFCWLRPLPDLLHIPKRRGSNETAVFTGEL